MNRVESTDTELMLEQKHNLRAMPIPIKNVVDSFLGPLIHSKILLWPLKVIKANRVFQSDQINEIRPVSYNNYPPIVLKNWCSFFD